MQQFLLRAAKRARFAALRRFRRVRPRARRLPPARSPGPTFALGLQGGGALGAFTWGVLDRLLETPGFRLAAATGASAGAVNAVVMASGWLNGGADGAKSALHRFWHRVGHLPSVLRPPLSSFWFDEGRGRSELPALAFEMATTVFSPYDLNPLNHNPLQPILAALVDFERLREADAPRLFVSATDVETGQARIFDNRDLSLDAVASKYNNDWSFIQHLHALGRREAERLV